MQVSEIIYQIIWKDNVYIAYQRLLIPLNARWYIVKVGYFLIKIDMILSMYVVYLHWRHVIDSDY